MHKSCLVFTLILILASCLSVQAVDYAQWRGSERNGHSEETSLLKKWPSSGPKQLWNTSGFGQGYSSPALAGQNIYLTGVVNGQFTLFCLDLKGNVKWKKQAGRGWTKSYPGARSTPTIDGRCVYVMSGYGETSCFDAKTGSRKWSVNTLKRFNGKNIKWGISESLLVEGNNVICTPGGPDASIVALNKNTGSTVWVSKGISELSAYCSPISITQGGKRIIITMLANNIVGLNAKNGKLLWKHPHSNKWKAHAVTPIHHEGMIYCTSGYGFGGVMLKLNNSGTSVQKVWTNKDLDCHHGGVVMVDGQIYGTSHRGAWVCLDWKNGTVKYKERGIGKGSCIYADGMLYGYSEKGTCGLIKTSSSGYDLRSSFKINQGSGEHWAHPVVAGGVMYIRHGNTLMAYKLK